MGSLFAGQLNSGISAAWMIIYLAANPEWYKIFQLMQLGHGQWRFAHVDTHHGGAALGAGDGIIQ